MKCLNWIATALACCLMAAAPVHGQAPAASQPRNAPPADAAKPASTPSKPGAGANPFPEDTSSVPVLPTANSAAPASEESVTAPAPLPGEDTDPARSPEDAISSAPSAQESDSSSSLKGLDNMLAAPDVEKPAKKQRSREEVTASDLDVGSYYLDRKNWRAALSRFQSALVLDPENPEVYWGLAESERNLGDFANARAHYLQLLAYDPDGPHGKQARKQLKDPAIAAATVPGPGPAGSKTPR